MENLWPAFEKREITTPKSVFEKQVEFFNSLDTGLKATLSQGLDDGGHLSFTFRIQASALNGYTFTLFRASNHATSIYPVLIDDKIQDRKYTTENQGQLEATLKEIFNSQALRKIIQNLIAQIYDDTLDF